MESVSSKLLFFLTQRHGGAKRRVKTNPSLAVIPEIYGGEESGLSATVVRGRNVFNFDLE